MYNIITIGDAVVDTHIDIDNASTECNVDTHICQLCFNYAEKIPITTSSQRLGGNAANVAKGIVKFGLKTAIIATLGDDSNGKIITEELNNLKVDTSFIEYDKKATTRYSIILNFKDERTILSYHNKRNYTWPAKMPHSDWIYYTSLSEGLEPLQQKLLQHLEKYPATKLAFNPGSYQLNNKIDLIKEILPKTDILIINIQEAEKILNTTFKKEKTIESIIHKLLAFGVKEVVITDSSNGSTAGNHQEIWHMPVYPVKIKIKTGAGDAFSSGYLFSKIQNNDTAAALRIGAANSALTISKSTSEQKEIDISAIQKISEIYSDIFPTKI